MPTVDTQLVDDDVVYCSPQDVFAHIRNKRYDDLPEDVDAATSAGALTQAQVDRIIGSKSERADNYTKRAWRTRKVVDYVKNVDLSHLQKHPKHRRRRFRRNGRRTSTAQAGQRVMVKLPHNHLKPIDPDEGDLVEMLFPRSSNDVTDEEGREEGQFVVDYRKGILRPTLQLLTPVGTQTQGPVLEEDMNQVRISYRYGFPKDVTDYDADGDGVSDHVPEDVRDAVALLTAAQIVGSDQYGEMVPSGGEDSPSLSDAASTWKSDAMDTLKDFRRV